VGSTQATTSIYTDVYIHIYTLFSTLFGDQNHHSTTIITAQQTPRATNTKHAINRHQKKNFPQKFTRFHKISQDFTIKKHQKTPKSPKSRKTRKNRLFGGTPPPPQKPLFSRVFGTPQIAQICTNLHKFAPICTPKTPLLGGTQFAGTLWIDPVRIFAKSGRAGITPILGGYRGGTPSVHNYTPPGPPRLYLNK